MPLVDPRHCWLTLVETPDGSQAVAMSPAETFDLDAAAALRDQVGEAAAISFIGNDAIAYCASARDLQACLAEWVELDLGDLVTTVTSEEGDLDQPDPDPGVVTRSDLLAILHEVRAVVDDAGRVVDPGEDEEVAYEHELRRLDTLVKRLTAGAIIAE